MSLPKRYKSTLEYLAFLVERTLYKSIDHAEMEDKLVGFEVDLGSFGKYQIACKIHKMKNNDIVEMTDEELNEIDWEEELQE